MNASPSPQSTNGAAAVDAGAPSPLAEFLVKPMQPHYNLALDPQNLDAVENMARRCAKMRLCGCESEDDAYLRIIAGRAIGLPAMASIQLIIPIYNKKTNSYTLTMYVKGKLALCLARPDIIEYIRPTLISDEKAIWVGKRVGGVEQSYEFTWEDAKKGGLVGRLSEDGSNSNNYDKHPKPMLSWRCAGRLLDLIAGDLLNGIASHELESDAAEDAERAAKDRGQVPATIAAQIPKRDFIAEADVLKQRLAQVVEAKDAAGLKEVRAQFKTLESEAPQDVVDGLKSFYNMVASAAKKTADAPKAAAPSATTSTPAQANLPAMASAAKPLEPAIPFGST